MKRSFADILQGLDSDRAQKVARKLPEWAAVGAEIPTALALEQCSSSATAGYKAIVAGQAASPVPANQAIINTILDLTGGLGVDSWALSQVAERVVYFERDADLAEAARRNFERLGAANIEVRCETVTPESELPESDLIYADPARRNAAGRKVFLLEDCTPDILTLLPVLLRKAPTVLLKLSPMADLAMLAGRLGPALREIHVVELDGEMKEILCLLQRDVEPAEPEIVIVRLSGQAATASHSGQLPPETSFGPHRFASLAVPPLTMPRVARFPEAVPADAPHFSPPPAPDEDMELLSVARSEATQGCSRGFAPSFMQCLRFLPSEERESEARYAAEVRPGDVLLEPCAALLKAGAFRLPCARWGLLKLAPSTHLYLYPSAPGAETGPGAPGIPFFKAWRVRDTLPFGAAAFKQLKQRCPRADVTSRNLPLGSDAIQKKLGIAPGGDVHIFACRLADASSILLVTVPAE